MVDSLIWPGFFQGGCRYQVSGENWHHFQQRVYLLFKTYLLKADLYSTAVMWKKCGMQNLLNALQKKALIVIWLSKYGTLICGLKIECWCCMILLYISCYFVYNSGSEIGPIIKSRKYSTMPSRRGEPVMILMMTCYRRWLSLPTSRFNYFFTYQLLFLKSTHCKHVPRY